MKSIIIGMGEVGSSLHKIISKIYPCETKDLAEKELGSDYQIMHVCIPYTETFEEEVKKYIATCQPRLINVCTTVPPGTTRKFGTNAVHSTTRGLHPHLETGLRTIAKHIGGECSPMVAEYFAFAGIRCRTHATPETTELAHILNNTSYGINLMYADEMAKLCRRFGVDYHEAVTLYTQSNNDGYHKLGHPSKARMILTPPGGRIGGHCVVHSANLIPEKERTPMLDMLAHYNENKVDPKSVKLTFVPAEDDDENRDA